MSKYVIADIDRQVCKGSCISLDTAMRKVQNYIIKHIDATFPCSDFKTWYCSDSDKPFVWNGNRYHWS